jgi:hypothetical protein
MLSRSRVVCFSLVLPEKVEVLQQTDSFDKASSWSFIKYFDVSGKTEKVVSRVVLLSEIVIGQVCVYPGHQVDGANEFCTLASCICGPSIWNLLYLKLLAARIIEVAPRCLENLSNPDLDSKNYLLMPLLYCVVCVTACSLPECPTFYLTSMNQETLLAKCYVSSEG